jgi:uncharacterized protein YyaL (SSP411 family)
MDVVQAITGRGGWPLTVFARPDGSPFFGGTYYRPDQFTQLLDAVHRVWHEQRSDVDTNVEALTEALGRTARMSPHGEVPELSLLETARELQAKAFDRVWGGFGPPPKFPSVSNLLLVARLAGAGDTEALTWLKVTLNAMASGGVYDHLAGGFARYSTDDRWLVPHFEKMLYDQALMIRAYTAGWQLTGNDVYTQVVSETIEYLCADMALVGGGFAAAEDADSPVPGSVERHIFIEHEADILCDVRQAAAGKPFVEHGRHPVQVGTLDVGADFHRHRPKQATVDGQDDQKPRG